MIALITLCCATPVWMLFKKGILRPTLATCAALGTGYSLFLAALIILVQTGAPASSMVQVYQSVIPIVPRVGGRVLEVPVEANRPVMKGDLLLRIDPEPFKIQLAQAEANAESARKRLAQNQDSQAVASARVEAEKTNLAKAQQSWEAARQQVAIAERQQKSRQEILASASADLSRTQGQIKIAEKEVGDMRKLVEKDAAPQDSLEKAIFNLATVRAQFESALAQERRSRLDAESVAELEGARATERQAKLAAESHALLTMAEADLRKVQAEAGILAETLKTAEAAQASARLDLAETSVYAPADGYVANLQLQPGSVVAAMPTASMMSFVCADRVAVVGFFLENSLRHVAPGQSADLALGLHPGATIKARVNSVVWITGEGQLLPSGAIPQVSTLRSGGRFAVKFDLDPEYAAFRLPGGATGSAAIYTDHATAIHVVRKIMMRIQTWMNYLFGS
ncbi:MAG: biotin/lipoyl-binding protein [Planctomycetes bacterium]|nr:biotin/lipoyl-binding protein [Planctomycetota bacterium]